MATKKEVKKVNASNGGGTGGSGAGGSDGGGGGGGSDLKPNGYKVSKLMLWPTRKVNLGNYSTLDLNAGIEIVFDNPVVIDSKEVKEALIDMRKIVGDEMKEQFNAFKPKKPAVVTKEAGK